MSVTDGDGDEGPRLGETLFETADGFEDLVPFLQASAADAGHELLQGLAETATLLAADGAFLGAARPAARQEIVNVLTLQQLDFDLGGVRQTLPTRPTQIVLERHQRRPACGQPAASAPRAAELQGVVTDHAAIHDPEQVDGAEAGFNGADQTLHGLEILRVAGPGVERQA